MLRLALLVLSAGGALASFQPNSLIVLRVGDGVTPLLSAGAVPAARTAPVFLDNYDPAFAATPLNAGSPAVAGVVVAGNDYSMGSLTLGERDEGRAGPAGASAGLRNDGRSLAERAHSPHTFHLPPAPLKDAGARLGDRARI